MKTFEHRTYVLPYADTAGTLVLSESELHVEQREATQDVHREVGDQKRTCSRGDGVGELLDNRMVIRGLHIILIDLFLKIVRFNHRAREK